MTRLHQNEHEQSVDMKH